MLKARKRRKMSTAMGRDGRQSCLPLLLLLDGQLFLIPQRIELKDVNE